MTLYLHLRCCLCLTAFNLIVCALDYQLGGQVFVMLQTSQDKMAIPAPASHPPLPPSQILTRQHVAMQDEVTNFRPQGSDLDYPGKLQQQQEKASSSSEQTPLTHQNGNTPAVSVPQQNTDSQVGVCIRPLLPTACKLLTPKWVRM